MTGQPLRIAVLGGGISGLSAAFYIQKLCKERSIPVDLTLIEADSRLGGKIQTLRKDGYIIERGPDSFLGRKMPIIDLSRELGLEGELIGTSPAAHKTFILHKDQLHVMPPGLVLGIPTQISPFMKTGLISLQGKVRAALDLVLPRRTSSEDESLGSFLTRRLGSEVLENIAEPLLAGIYAGDTRNLSLQATFPQFKQVEHRYRSLILGMLASKKQAPQIPGLPEIAKKSMFLTYRRGLSTLVEALELSLTNSRIRLNSMVKSLIQEAGKYKIILSDGETMEVDGVVSALPAYQSSQLLAPIIDTAALASINYVSVVNVILGFDYSQIVRPFAGAGFVVPKQENRWITACTWTSSKWEHAAPKDKVLVRCYMGRAGDESWTALSEEQIIHRAREDLKHILGLTAEPQFSIVTPWKQSMPQYKVGHLDRLSEFTSAISAKLPGVVLTGAGYGGVGLPDCIRQGKTAAEAILQHMASTALTDLNPK